MRLIERDGALRTLLEVAGAAAEGRGQIALISGEAGIGKSSVLRALAEHWRRTGSVWWGLCDPLETPQPLGPLLGLDAAVRATWSAGLDSPRATLFAAILDALKKAEAPVLLVIEDVHWSDDATLDLLRFIGRRIDGVRALLAVSYRDDEVGVRHPLRRMIGALPPACCTRLSLPRLSARGIEEMACSFGKLPGKVHAVSGGNPFASEMLRADAPDVPASVNDLVLSRYAALPAGAARVAELVAVMPGRAELQLIHELLHPIPEDLEAAQRSGLIEDDGLNLAYRHELARVAVEAALSQVQSQRLHALVLAALEQRPAATHARRVHHAVRARDRQAVARLAPLAAQEATARGAHAEAAAQWSAALDCSDPPDDAALFQWLDQHATACSYAEQIPAARASLRRLRVLAEAQGNLGEVGLSYTKEAILCWGLGDLSESIALSERAVLLLESVSDTGSQARALRQRTAVLMAEHRIVECVHFVNRRIALASQSGSRLEELLAQRDLYFARLHSGDASAYEHLPSLYQTMLDEGLQLAAGLTAANIGMLSVEHARWPTAVAWLRKVLVVEEARDMDRLTTISHAWLAMALVRMGAWTEAASHCEAVFSRYACSPFYRAVALFALARMRLRRGVAGVEEALEEAESLIHGDGTLQRRALSAGVRAEMAALRGDAATFQQVVDAILPLAVARRHAGLIAELRCHARTLGRAVDIGRLGTGDELDGSSARIGADAIFVVEAAGDWRAAAAAWAALEAPYEQARALGGGDTEAQHKALALFESLGAWPAAHALKQRLKGAGQRLPRESTRSHPHGLTTAELDVLRHLARGRRNAEIASHLHRSTRTIENHVAAILQKLDTPSRRDAADKASREGWLDVGHAAAGASPVDPRVAKALLAGGRIDVCLEVVGYGLHLIIQLSFAA